ncbi:MAG: aspartate dehydrogenase [Chloroflexi bacterium]|jgi:aspartate dehydrogenase|nr:MAG: aspartate dehydrogenase [Chloroflexota bacterium]
MLSIAVVGCGAIGRALLRAVDDGHLPVKVVGVASRGEERAKAFLATLGNPVDYLSPQDLVERADLVIEAAGADVVPDLARLTFGAGKDLMVISVGALLDHPELVAVAVERSCRLFVPSGAIAGLDGIKSAAEGRIDHVTMTSRKPPEALQGAPFLVDKGMSLEGLEEERLLFEGSAREACKGFPANVNVSAAVSLAGIGPDRTRVRIIAVPGLTRNCHDIEVEGEFGRLAVHIENVPTENPRTGKLTALSIIRTVREITASLKVGT